MLYGLARADAGDYSRSASLFTVKDKLPLYARALLALDFHVLGADANYVDPIISDLVSKAILTPTGVHWEENYDDFLNWNTDTRTTAIVLQALVETQPTNQLIPNVVRWLMSARKADAWETTQETAWSVMALTDWMQYTGELKANYAYGVRLNDKALASDQKVTRDNLKDTLNLYVPVKDLLSDQINKLDFERTGGEGTMYYTANLTTFVPIEQIRSVTHGVSLTRSYSLVNDKDHKPITEVHVGDTVRVTLTIIAPNDLHYIVINDPIPAGSEAIDPKLPTSPNIGEMPSLKLDDPLSQGWGWWWFSKTELRDDRVVLYASYLPRGTYQYTYTVYAGLAGEYRVIPSTGQEFYNPVVYGRGDGTLFTILPEGVALKAQSVPDVPAKTEVF